MLRFSVTRVIQSMRSCCVWYIGNVHLTSNHCCVLGGRIGPLDKAGDYSQDHYHVGFCRLWQAQEQPHAASPDALDCALRTYIITVSTASHECLYASRSVPSSNLHDVLRRVILYPLRMDRQRYSAAFAACLLRAARLAIPAHAQLY